MAQVLFIGQENERDTRPLATRLLTVCDSCVGTERLLLHASNFSLRLCGVDLDAMLCLCLATLVNGFVLAPWLVKPLPFLDGLQLPTKKQRRFVGGNGIVRTNSSGSAMRSATT